MDKKMAAVTYDKNAKKNSIAILSKSRSQTNYHITALLDSIKKKICPGVQDAEEQKALGCVEHINTSLCEKNDGHLQVQILCT